METRVLVHCYRVVVAGGLGRASRQAFDGFDIAPNGANTALSADLDQAGLFAALNRVVALGLELVEVRRVD
jgi:hypothetical protein